MRLATVRIAGTAHFGAVTDQGFIDLGARFKERCADIPDLLRKNLLGEAAKLCAGAKPDVALDKLEYLPVISNLDSRVFALGWSYKEHQVETGKEAPAYPAIFDKHPQALVGHGQPLIKPWASETYDFEGEIALIIGKAGRHIPAKDAMDYIAGYSILMDGSVREWQKHSLTAGKNFDSSSSYGPWMVTKDEIPDPKQMTLTTRLNNNQMQHSSFANMVWDLGFLINYVSTFCELQPGDAISTGTPSGVGARRTPPVFMKAGDTLEIEVTGIGTLRNKVVDEPKR